MDAAWVRRAASLEPHLHTRTVSVSLLCKACQSNMFLHCPLSYPDPDSTLLSPCFLCSLRTVPGDGDCQFHAVAFHAGSSWTAHSLRIAAVRYAAEHPLDFAAFFAVASGDTLDSWLSRMSRQGYWGDNLSLFCLAHVLQRPIFIYRQGATPQALVPPILRPEAAPVTLWLDESRPGLEHYSPLTTAPPARKRLLSKQHDPCPPASAPCVRQLPPRAAKNRGPPEEHARRCCQCHDDVCWTLTELQQDGLYDVVEPQLKTLAAFASFLLALSTRFAKTCP